MITFILSLIGGYVFVAAVVYGILRYAQKLDRQEARPAAIGWGRTLYVAIRRMLERKE